MSTTLAKIVRKLSTLSARVYPIPSDTIDWPEQLSHDHWYTSPELISIYGTPYWEALSEAQHKKLSFFEAVNFYSLNINGEKPLVKGLSDRLYSNGREDVTAYLHHFLDEENKHMQYFGRFCMAYAGKVYPDKKLVFPRQYADGEDNFMFFVQVMIFEEIADYYNSAQAKDERLHPLARRINLLHHQDEARHLVFGREYVAELWKRFAPRWPSDVIEGVHSRIADYLQAAWKAYYNPEMYADAGLHNGYEIFEQAFASERASAHRQSVSKKVVAYLLNNEMLLEAPTL